MKFAENSIKVVLPLLKSEFKKKTSFQCQLPPPLPKKKGQNETEHREESD